MSLLKIAGVDKMDVINRPRGSHQAADFLVLLLSADVFLILLHWLHLASKTVHIPALPARIGEYAFNITAEMGLGESFGYVKEFWIVMIFVYLIFKKRLYSYIGWAFLFAYLLFDDMLSVHEGLAALLLGKLGFPPEQVIFTKVRYQDFGEIGVNLIFGFLFLALIAFMYLRSNKEVRRTFHYLMGGLLLLVFFGVIADFGGRLLTNKIVNYVAATIEDGGEMIAMSLICWYVLTLKEQPPNADPVVTAQGP